ncbi:hypothetical protein R3P38DRAFT_3003420, partial [Favolaschia claudopus]
MSRLNNLPVVFAADCSLGLAAATCAYGFYFVVVVNSASVRRLVSVQTTHPPSTAFSASIPNGLSLGTSRQPVVLFVLDPGYIRAEDNFRSTSPRAVAPTQAATVAAPLVFFAT